MTGPGSGVAGECRAYKTATKTPSQRTYVCRSIVVVVDGFLMMLLP